MKKEMEIHQMVEWNITHLRYRHMNMNDRLLHLHPWSGSLQSWICKCLVCQGSSGCIGRHQVWYRDIPDSIPGYRTCAKGIDSRFSWSGTDRYMKSEGYWTKTCVRSNKAKLRLVTDKHVQSLFLRLPIVLQEIAAEVPPPIDWINSIGYFRVNVELSIYVLVVWLRQCSKSQRSWFQ